MNRADACFLIEASLAAGRPEYARAVARAFLAAWPGDLAMRWYFARACLAENRAEVGYPLALLHSIAAVDLENAAALRLIGELCPDRRTEAYASAHVIDGKPLPADFRAPGWTPPARRASVSLAAGQFAAARQFAEAALRAAAAPPTSASSVEPLLSILLLKSHWQARELALALPLAEGFHERWPKSAAIMLCLAEGLFNAGQAHRAVEVLHTVSALDPAGDVVSRYWGRSHPYRNLWPAAAPVQLPGPIPSEVIKLLGLNRLGSGEGRAAKPEARARRMRKMPQRKSGAQAPYTPPPPPAGAGGEAGRAEEVRDIQARIDEVAAQISSARYHRRPVHLILYSEQQLRAKFGPEASAGIVGLIEELAAATARARKVPVVMLLPEAPPDSFNLPPVDPANAWAVKMMLHDIDRKLARRGQAIGSLLIVGGDDLLPFHRLPNPTDDVDNDIPSDNPYGTTDDNYFIPEWPVGRLPSPCGRDPEPLRLVLRHAVEAHRAAAGHGSAAKSLWRNLLKLFSGAPTPSSVGYSASVWKEASAEVFAPVGGVERLHTSPPLDADSAPPTDQLELSYFNLHGIEDGPEWFGQREFDDGGGPYYPLALQPSGVSGGAPGVVFSEACYGANILNKQQPDAALCLRFLCCGARALVGSTKISYGSIAAPLIGADLLGRSFWENVLAGLPTGEALRRAKLGLAQAMHKRQGFLDGEDQKTLISFVLYGDPTLPALPRRRPARQVSKSPQTVRTVLMEYDSAAQEVQPQAVAEIKAVLSRYLPGAESADVRVARPLSPVGAKAKAAPAHRVYTLAKTLQINAHTLPSYARVTVDSSGAIVKVAVSR